MNYLVGSMQHISIIFFVVFFFKALIEDSIGIDWLLIEIFDKFFLLIPCPSFNSSSSFTVSVLRFIVLSRYLKGIHSFSYLPKDFKFIFIITFNQESFKLKISEMISRKKKSCHGPKCQRREKLSYTLQHRYFEHR